MVTSVKNPSGVHANIDEKPFHERDRRFICSSKPVLKLPGATAHRGTPCLMRSDNAEPVIVPGPSGVQ